MENGIKFDIGWKRKARENFILGAQRLLGIVRNTYHKIRHLRSATTHFTAYNTTENLKDYEIKAEQMKAEAIGFLLKENLTIQ